MIRERKKTPHGFTDLNTKPLKYSGLVLLVWGYCTTPTQFSRFCTHPGTLSGRDSFTKIIKGAPRGAPLTQ